MRLWVRLYGCLSSVAVLFYFYYGCLRAFVLCLFSLFSSWPEDYDNFSRLGVSFTKFNCFKTPFTRAFHGLLHLWRLWILGRSVLRPGRPVHPWFAKCWRRWDYSARAVCCCVATIVASPRTVYIERAAECQHGDSRDPPVLSSSLLPASSPSCPC
jgi:hypothetical protein